MLIYHYTSLGTFFELINAYRRDKHLTLWASSAYALNDAAEMQGGYSFIREFLQSYEQNEKEEKKLSVLLPPEGGKYFTGDDKDFYMSNVNTPFVLCFTGKGDYLPMWSMYGDNGGGVCLGFDGNIMDRIQDVHCLADVTYYGDNIIDVEGWNDLKRFLYNEADKCHLLLDCISCNDFSTLKSFYLNKLCPIISAFIKRAEFRYEDETRMMLLHNATKDDVFFRKGINGNIIPYIKVKIPIESLQEIILGPCIATPQNMRDMESMKAICRQSWMIKNSNIPYRIL